MGEAFPGSLRQRGVSLQELKMNRRELLKTLSGGFGYLALISLVPLT